MDRHVRCDKIAHFRSRLNWKSCLLNEGRIIRFGHPRDPVVTAEPRLFPNKVLVQQVRRALHDAQQELRVLKQEDLEGRARLQRKIFDLKSWLRTLTKELIDQSRIILTTAVHTCIEPATAESSFDFVVIDEASMMPMPYVVCVGGLGRD
jgi:tRNA(Met) C34 N-acetyltransferase TmcA